VPASPYFYLASSPQFFVSLDFETSLQYQAKMFDRRRLTAKRRFVEPSLQSISGSTRCQGAMAKPWDNAELKNEKGGDSFGF